MHAALPPDSTTYMHSLLLLHAWPLEQLPQDIVPPQPSLMLPQELAGHALGVQGFLHAPSLQI